MTFRAAIVIVCLAGCPRLAFAGQAGVGQPDSDPTSGLARAASRQPASSARRPDHAVRAHTDRHITMGSVQVGRVMTGRIGPGPLAGRFERPGSHAS